MTSRLNREKRVNAALRTRSIRSRLHMYSENSAAARLLRHSTVDRATAVTRHASHVVSRGVLQ